MNEESLAKKITENTTFLTRVACRALAFLLLHDTDYKTSQEIEYTMRLRQPEVSQALSLFRKYKWITEKSMPKASNKKGRPIKLIKLAKNRNDIFKHLVDETDKEAAKFTKQKEELLKISELLLTEKS